VVPAVVNTELFGGGSFRVREVEFVSAYGASTVDRFCVFKTAEQLEFFVRLCRRFRGSSIVELGIAAGGSAALLALMARPHKLVAVDIAETPVAALDELIAREGLDERVRPHYGVDQADGSRLVEIVEAEFGDDPLDLVIDDASHLLGPTTTSFEALFPLLRPGGVYVIEDWNASHRAADAMEGTSKDGAVLPEPLTRLLLELMLVRGSSGDVVRELSIGDLWASVERGPAELDPRTFRVRDHYVDHFGLFGP
jgi:predicted O-methyltransferase YrrM